MRGEATTLRSRPRRRINAPARVAGQSDSRLLSLPPEGLEHVLSHLPPRALARALACCRALSAAARVPSLWRPHCLELWEDDDFSAGPVASPARYAMRHGLFRRVHATTTHLSNEENVKVCTVLEAMGGKYDDALTTACTHVICGAGYTSKALAAREHGRMHLVTPEWIWKSAQLARRLDERDACVAVPPLLGARISTSGLSPRWRRTVEAIVTE